MSEALLLRLSPRDLASGRPYAERDERPPAWHDELALGLWHGAVRPLWRQFGGHAASAQRVVALTRSFEAQMAALDDAALRTRAAALRHELRRSQFGAEPTAHFFALLREVAGRVLGKRHYDSQVHAGWLLLHGALVEMSTGEGKTFAATLPACTAALVGLPVHVVTVNDYLAARDAEAMGRLYAFFGLRCGAIVHEQTREQRRGVYAGDIAYASNKELTFDYLRDRTALGDRASPLHRAVAQAAGGSTGPATVLRGLAFAIVDEADSVFIDEARTPLILSATLPGGQRSRIVGWALAFAAGLQPGVDFEVERAFMRVRLTDTGRDRIETLVDDAAQVDESVAAVMPVDTDLPSGATRRGCTEAVTQALSALWLYHRDQQYVVADGKVQIVDESTGRVMADRAWERGLHQMIEAKEGLDVTGERVTLARITYQRFFRRYLRLAGMTGTATEVAAEIGRVYGLPVWRVPLNRPSRARLALPRCLRSSDTRWEAVVASVHEHAVERGRPVLVGTRTVLASEQLSARLAAAAIPHVVLNAKHDRDEAEIIARAGVAGTVTVATNMAGRGTDIVLGPGVAERGGLHVILSEYHESARIDRQLFGRAARQGDPGSGEALVAVDDELFRIHAPALAALAQRWLAVRAELPVAIIWLLRRAAQASAEARNRSARTASLKQDRRLAAVLAFSGRGE
ncbi:MAG: preprotein translocase subunit SecA [Roseateles sp.]|uniref:preprotein translocase subunit SecA n=1 Tax=Roseateles sp. TaxID=1971397 RepID=UPI004036A3B1